MVSYTCAVRQCRYELLVAPLFAAEPSSLQKPLFAAEPVSTARLLVPSVYLYIDHLAYAVFNGVGLAGFKSKIMFFLLVLTVRPFFVFYYFFLYIIFLYRLVS